MIFKKFDNDSDKFFSKIGILGKSFEQIGTSIRQRKIEINSLMGAMSKKEAKTEVGGFWSYVFGNKSTKEKPIDLSNFIDLDNSKVSNLLKSLQGIEVSSKINTSAWQEYFSTLSDGQKRQIEFVKNNNLQKTSTEDLVKANQQARASALAHNEAIKAQTFSAKASKVALQALAMAGNMILFAGITKGIELVIQGIDQSINRVKYAQEAMEKAQQAIDESQNKLKSTNETISKNKDRFLELSQGVDRFSKNKFLSDDDYSEFLSISQQLAEISPNLIVSYDEQGNALLRLGKNAKETGAMLDEMLDVQKTATNKTLADNLTQLQTVYMKA